MRVLLNVIAALLLAGVASGPDITANGIKFYAVIEADGVAHVGGRTINVKKGNKLEFHEYAPHSGLAPNMIDVSVFVVNQDIQAENIEIRLAISPKVGKVVLHQGTPDLPIHKETEASAEWFAPIILLKQTVKSLPLGREVEITFRSINLEAVLKDYMKRNLWPVMLNFEASVEASVTEQAFKNNTVKRAIKLRMWE